MFLQKEEKNDGKNERRAVPDYNGNRLYGLHERSLHG